MLGSREVQGVILAVITVSSLATAALIVNVVHHGEYDAIGLLNTECKIGGYPSTVIVPSNITLCLYVENHRAEASYYMIVYKIADNQSLPSAETPSPQSPLKEWRIVLAPMQNTTLRVVVPVTTANTSMREEKIALVFELWRFDPSNSTWVYTGRWVHLYVTPTHEVIPGG